MGVISEYRKAAECTNTFGGYVSLVTAKIFPFRANSKQLDTMEQVKQAVACEIADKYGVKFEDDIAELEKRLKSLQCKVKSVKADLPDEQLKLKRVSDLITAYEKIVEGNYIDNLVRVQKEQDKTLDNANLIK